MFLICLSPGIQRPALSIILFIKFIEFEFTRPTNPLLVILQLIESIHGISRVGIRCSTPAVPQRREISPVRIICDQKPKHRPRRHIVNIVSIVLTPRNGNKCSSQQRSKRKQHARQIRTRSEDVALPCQEQGEISQPTECEAAVS